MAPGTLLLPPSFFCLAAALVFASGGQGGRFLKKLPPLDPPAKTFDYYS
jgi:hypothetical protein